MQEVITDFYSQSSKRDVNKVNLLTLLMIRLFFTLTVAISFTTGFSQPLTHTIRGSVLELSTHQPLPGASIVLEGVPDYPLTISDAHGAFLMEGVPVGRRVVRISFVGFETVVLSNIQVGSGKEVVLEVHMVESVYTLTELAITTSKNSQPINEMSLVSARSFTEEETRRFPASVGDPLRLAASFAGTAALDDESNEIIIRGNTPRGILWKLEGIEVPSPNHFSAEGTSSGGISMFSSQVISRSDFLTGAFAAEYGNATAGVFDIHLRHGNNSRHEGIIQAGLLGLDASAEGPLGGSHQSSYLFNYRYSTLSLLSMIGLEIQDDGENNTFQDLSFKFNFPTVQGAISIFGLGGLSSANQVVATSIDREDYNMGVLGISYQTRVASNTLLRTTVAASATRNVDILQPGNGYSNDRYFNKTFTRAYAMISHKVNARHWLEGGITWSQLGYDFRSQIIDPASPPPYDNFSPFGDDGRSQTQQIFLSWHQAIGDRLTTVAGLHAFRFALTAETSLEPRASLYWQATKRGSFSLGYGLHSRIESLEYYLGKFTDANGQATQNNLDLGLTKAHHFVAGYAFQLNRLTTIKTELYFQKLFNVPVLADVSGVPFSSINFASGYTVVDLSNVGTGSNYGIELSLEKRLENALFYLINASLYDSRYSASDGIERNTRFNGSYASNVLIGKEFSIRANAAFGASFRINYSGNKRYTPIDLGQSQSLGRETRDSSLAYTERYPDHFRVDVQLNWRINRPRFTSEIRIDLQNLTNRKNVLTDYYQNGAIALEKGPGLIPVFSYRVEF